MWRTFLMPEMYDSLIKDRISELGFCSSVIEVTPDDEDIMKTTEPRPMLNFPIPSEMKAELLALCEELDMSQCGFVRVAVAEHIKRTKRQREMLATMEDQL
ncbi:hypothetical protein [Paraburkholderia terrae]|uniref:hypothetical protein n=1 Tax=Paraburkholderia terrae TaxID=311230 RepID=UPI001EE2660A|nr:hypothetical protein [Paraburkholderia terrae]GJH02283.1 hypothetical protein CBA19C8_17020 [Paraburkholderia terrae]